MKRILKGIWKFLCSLLSLLLVILIVSGFWFGVRGYQMYRTAVEEVPFSEKAEIIWNREGFTEFAELPDIYIDAVIAVEDKRFWRHKGIDYLSICRAAWNDLCAFSLMEGGSTITQQLMKNEYFTQDKKLERKFAEAFAAMALEKEYTKEEIFEFYVNTIYFGSGYYGIYDAAQGYFGKEPWELSDYEAVLLAGLPNAPSIYSPKANPELAEQRMKQVLKQMEKCEMLSKEKISEIQNYLSVRFLCADTGTFSNVLR